MSDLSAEFLRSILDYDPDTGIFRWRAGYTRGVSAGRMAGRVNGQGYGSISIRNKHRSTHRLAWLYVYGVWPPASVHVDHINGNRADNRIANLRLATPQQNAHNRGRHIGGKKGTTFNKQARKWQASIRRPDGVDLYLGLYETEDAAHARYAEAAREYFGAFARAD